MEEIYTAMHIKTHWIYAVCFEHKLLIAEAPAGLMVMVTVMIMVTCKHSEALPSEMFSESQSKASVASSYQHRLVLQETSLTTDWLYPTFPHLNLQL